MTINLSQLTIAENGKLTTYPNHAAFWAEVMRGVERRAYPVFVIA